MSALMVEILTPERTLYLGKAEAVIARAIDGDVEIRPGHIPYVNALSPGEIRMYTEDKTCLHFKHNGGFLDVGREKTSILVRPAK